MSFLDSITSLNQGAGHQAPLPTLAEEASDEGNAADEEAIGEESAHAPLPQAGQSSNPTQRLDPSFVHFMCQPAGCSLQPAGWCIKTVIVSK